MIGQSAQERDLRERLQFVRHTGDGVSVPIPAGVLRGVLRDMDMWRRILATEMDTWGFDTLVIIARHILNERYPADIFDGSSGDIGPEFIVRLRAVIKELE